MKQQRSRSRIWKLAMAYTTALSMLACGDSLHDQDGGPSGAGGFTLPGSGGSGGNPGLGGAGGQAGVGGASPDAAIGGEGGSVGGAGGTVPDTTCATDAECAGFFCEPTTRRCVECTRTANCPSGGHCRANACVTLPPACEDSLGCDANQVCDGSRGLCVECAKAADCTAGQDCVANRCVAGGTCQTSLDCGNKVCDPGSKKCVDCVGDNDCNISGTTTISHCIRNVCKPECLSDKQCTPEGMLCDASLKVCARCKSNGDCPASSFCEGGECKPDVCDATEAQCVSNGVAQCNPAGSGFGQVNNCPSEKPCKARGGAAACGGPPLPVDGGVQPPIDGGSSPIDGGLASCTPEAVNPCDRIPAFVGTQTVDGRNEDLCNVPMFVLDKASASANGLVNNFNGIPDAELPVVTARVAWSAAGLHGFFEIVDPKVQSVSMADPGQALAMPYQGDSLELFFSSNDTATGAPGGDSGAVHVTLAATGKSAAVTTTNNNGVSASYAELPDAQYAQVRTATGYAVEVLIPWRGGAPGAGARIRFDLALNIADGSFGGVADMRDAQLVYYVASNGQSSCPGAPEPWCDDRTWCSTSLQ